MKINLPYGKKSIILTIPEDKVQIIKPKVSSSSGENKKLLEEAMNNPLGTRKLEDLVKGKKVCALIEDGTRGQPHAQEIEISCKRLKEADFVQFIITTGSHEPQTQENLKIAGYIRKSSEAYHLRYNVIIHDCEDKQLVEVGTTSRGTRVVAERFTQEAEVFFIIANMKNHYFAGYCNAVKNFLPGVCSFETIEQNHKLALEEDATFGQHPWHPDPARRQNSVSEDMIEAMNLITRGKPICVLGTIGSKDLIWAAFGEINRVTTEGIKVIDQTTSFRIQPSDFVIVCPGGHPEDETLYTAQRGLDLVKNAIRDGGEVLLIASCHGGYMGLAPSEKAKKFFYDSLLINKPRGKLAPEIKKNYRLFKQKAYKMAEVIDRVNKIWLYSELEEEAIRKIHLYPTPDPQRIINHWLKRKANQILLFENANKLAIYVA